ncbi:hypothetical protein [uncultured Methanomethylovorans sp.]|jgi:hypothetical protein|uniref:hypothetical protein n=1 Tax=uncultured Methanomethylovorans sp. TaxID=183759 RepID=UPI002AA8343B|nr:hypothetical protein [uncultured Methanomethylovorans sp.]
MIPEDDGEEIILKLSIDENGNAMLRLPSPKVSFEMDEDKMIRFVVALQRNTEICDMLEGVDITVENLDQDVFFEKLNRVIEEVQA